MSDGEEEAGIFTWELATDTVYGDTALARLFGLDPEKAITGLPIARYMARVYLDDQPDVAKLIWQAVVDGLPYRAEYRVVDALGTVTRVMAHGRCFRDHQGNPVHYAGIVHPVDDLPDVGIEDKISVLKPDDARSSKSGTRH